MPDWDPKHFEKQTLTSGPYPNVQRASGSLLLNDGDHITDSGGDQRITFTDAGSTLFKNAAGTTGITLDSSNNTTLAGNLTMADGKNIIFDTTNGTKIGTAVGQKIGFFGVTPVGQNTTQITQTYSTTVTTHANMTAPAAGAGSGEDATTFNGAECDALVADVVGVKGVVNTIIDRLQELGLLKV